MIAMLQMIMGDQATIDSLPQSLEVTVDSNDIKGTK